MSEFDLIGRAHALQADPFSCAPYLEPHEELDNESIQKLKRCRENEDIWRIVTLTLGNRVVRWTRPNFESGKFQGVPSTPPDIGRNQKKKLNSKMAIAQANWAAWVLSGFSFYDEIAALDPLDLDSLYTSAVLSKQQYFIDDHNLAADFKHWVKMPYWSPFEGVMLIHALDPSASALDVIHQHSRMDEQKKWPLFIALAQSTAIVERTQFDGLRATMMNEIEPVNFVKKVISLGLDVHPDLLAELENQGKWPPIEEGKLPSNEKLESEIEKRNRLRLIGFLIQLLRTDKAKKFASDDQLKDRLVELDEGQHGLSKRNLDAIFSAAKKELPSSRSQS